MDEQEDKIGLWMIVGITVTIIALIIFLGVDACTDINWMDQGDY